MSNKKVVITGASRGIGAQTAKKFSSSGFRVFGTVTPNGNPKNYCYDWIVADFSDSSQINNCAMAIKKIKPDILINCAGVNNIDKFTKIKSEDFLSIQQINLFAPFIFLSGSNS